MRRIGELDRAEQRAQADVEHAAHAGLHHDVLLHRGHESGERDADGVEFRQQAEEMERAAVVGQSL